MGGLVGESQKRERVKIFERKELCGKGEGMGRKGGRERGKGKNDEDIRRDHKCRQGEGDENYILWSQYRLLCISRRRTRQGNTSYQCMNTGR